ncbi:hypothetical protein [Fusobacterium polymorphum]|uniref:hypothetical protein n=1 Tax=Fusobacterium nucleatum subsp. polymorphum TaxID=76857 RepID=UPI0030089C27
MDFKCFFIEYKIGLKDIKDRIPLKELLKLKYKKTIFKIFFLEVFISLLIFTSIILKLGNEKVIKIVTLVMYLIFILEFVFLLYFENRKVNQKVRLDLFYKKYSFKRKIFLISLLKKYKVQINNIDTLTFFINETKRAKKEIELFLFFIKLGKYFSPIIISLIIYFIQKLIEEKLYELAILLLLIPLFFFLVVYSIWSVFYPIIFSKYDYLIYDLNQIIIFNKHYSNIDKNS